jgi:hypothetical protein
VWGILSRQGKFIKDGKMISARDEGIAELTSQSRTFTQKALPIRQALEIDIG